MEIQTAQKTDCNKPTGGLSRRLLNVPYVPSRQAPPGPTGKIRDGDLKSGHLAILCHHEANSLAAGFLTPCKHGSRQQDDFVKDAVFCRLRPVLLSSKARKRCEAIAAEYLGKLGLWRSIIENGPLHTAGD